MDFEQFFNESKKIFSPGYVFKNPRSGETKIISFSNDGIVQYRRKKSNISFNIKYFYDSYIIFKGKKCASNDLKNYLPKVFNSKSRPAGHDCNCTVFFHLLNRLGVSSNIMGSGVRGSPFYVNIY